MPLLPILRLGGAAPAAEPGRRAPRFRCLTLALVFAVPALSLGWLAWGDPAVEFLPPGRADWVIDPRWELANPRLEVPPVTATTYRLRLDPGVRRPQRLGVEVTAPGDFRLAVDGVPRFHSGELRRHWKRPVRLDLAPWLGEGTSELRIEVRNPAGPVPLRIRAVDGAPRDLDTGSGSPPPDGIDDGGGSRIGAWEASSGGEPWTAAVPAHTGQPELSRWARDPAWPVLALLAFAVALTAIGLLRRGSPLPQRSRYRLVPVLAAIGVAGCHLLHAWSDPYQRSGMDLQGHLQYVRHASREGTSARRRPAGGSSALAGW